jgi:hypothetical protein
MNESTQPLSRSEKRRLANRVRILESGHIAFLYRPKIGIEVQSERDIDRLQIVAQPHEQILYRVLTISAQRLPEVRRRGERAHAVIELWRSPVTLQKSLGSKPKLPDAARLAGEGIYCIVRHADHLHLVYALTRPAGKGDVQRALNIEQEGSYIVGIAIGGDATESIRAFLEAKTEPCTLIGANEDIEGELGIELEPETRVDGSLDLRKALGVKTSLLEPLFAGHWR